MVEYIIDGCNFVKAAPDAEFGVFESVKSRFIARLRAYTKNKKVSMTVVFDSSRPSTQSSGRVRVIHTADADRRIAAEVARRKSPRSITVVSNDRALIREVKDTGAGHMSVAAFDDFLEKSLAGRPGADQSGHEDDKGGEKPAADGLSPEEVRQWKKELGL